MTYESLINQIENLSFIKDVNIKVKKIKFCGNKNGNNRKIWVYFDKQKYPCGVMLTGKFGTYTQREPTFIIGVNSNDKDGWTKEIRRELCHWLYTRFWIYIKGVDIMYDQYVNGNWSKHSFMSYDDKWDVNVFTKIIHDGWSIQKNAMKHLLEFPPLAAMYHWYNDDVKDNLYKNFGPIEYGNETYKELTTIEEFKKVTMGF